MTGAPRRTVLEALAESLSAAGVYNRGVMVGPAAILWTDETRQWEALIPLLRELLPSLVTLGDYNETGRTGPAIWIRCLLAGELEARVWPGTSQPIVYLPGVGRQMLRAIESCPRHLQPLAELQYRGALWSQHNGRDWTVLAFLKSEKSLGLDIAEDRPTAEAMQRALLGLADTPVDRLQGRRLEAADFDQLLSPDPERDLLRWMSDPAAGASWGPDHWGAFRSICRTTYGFDPQTDGALTAAERMASREGAWKQVWHRFAEAPRTYPGIAALLEKAHPSTLLFDPSSWPKHNSQAEATLRSSLGALDSVAPADAVARLHKLESDHGPRRAWVWADLGHSPLAAALQHLKVVADVCGSALGGGSPDEVASVYEQSAWRADSAALSALATVDRAEDVAAVKTALQVVYAPWLGDAADHLQKLIGQRGYPGARPDATGPVVAAAGECIFFADGLRFDVGMRLRDLLDGRGFRTELGVRWSALPSVTPTCKPSVSPIAGSVVGSELNDDFQPDDASERKPLSIDRFRKLLDVAGYQVLRGEENGDPTGRAWLEHGELDHMGHEQGWKLARRIDEQVREMAERIEALLDAGWRSVKVVTDHGWLLIPGGLPKVELPRFLSDTQWGRCAVLKSSAKGDGLLVVDWRWSSSVRIALAPGIGCFKAGIEYAHGGLSLQECLTPVLGVKRGVVVATASIVNVEWKGLRCRVLVKASDDGYKVDIRTKAADANTSVATEPKALDTDGRASLVVPNDDLIGSATYVVVVDAGGTPVAKTATCIGGGT